MDAPEHPQPDELRWLSAAAASSAGATCPAKFNAGQKMIFWVVIIGGVSVSPSGLSLLFPFELPMFAKTFGC